MRIVRDYEAENEVLRAENERMRAALYKIANPYHLLINYVSCDTAYLIKTAQEALEARE